MTDSASFRRDGPLQGPSIFRVVVLGPGVLLGPLLGLLFVLLLAMASGNSHAATFVVTNINAPGVGFNDTTPVAAVAGNPATTVGAQRMAVFQAAADSWGALLQSPVSIVVSAQMTSLTCATNSAVLGSAGADAVFRNFQNAPLTDTWYPVALANASAGFDLDPGSADINANFNQDIGKPNCMATRPWSYVIGVPAPTNTISFFDTVVHEIGHGLGVFSMVNTSTGEMAWGLSDSYTQHLLDETPTPVLWPALNNAGRAASAIDTGNLTWNGGSVNAVASLLTAGRHLSSSRVRMYAPSSLAGGSSVSHFDTALSPHEIMEPSLQVVTRRRLANHLMLDLGWRARVNLSVSNSDNFVDVPAGSATTYTITVQNDSVADLTAIDLGVINTMPAALQGVSWSCSGLAGGACTVASGVGDIGTQVTIPQAGSVVFTINAAISGSFTGTLANTVNLVLPDNLENHNPATLTATDFTQVVLPSDPAGISVSTISGNTTENGSSATFSVVLDSQPSANVSLGLNSSDSTEGTAAPGTLAFNSANWDVPQIVTVTGQNDFIDDGNIAYSIMTQIAVSSDPSYSGLNPADVPVINIDNDIAGISVNTISNDTDEAGQTATFSVVLNSEPQADVHIASSSNDSTEGSVSPASRVFNSANWSTPQLFTVTGLDDDVDDGNVTYTIITADASSADASYQGLSLSDVSVTNLDDDTAGFEISPVSGNTSETGLTATFVIEMNSEPTADVSISLSSSNETEGLVSPNTVSFTPATWFEARLVTITGQDDPQKDGDVTYSIITAPVISVDPNYSGLDPADVNLSNIDDDSDKIFKDGFD